MTVIMLLQREHAIIKTDIIIHRMSVRTKGFKRKIFFLQILLSIRFHSSLKSILVCYYSFYV